MGGGGFNGADQWQLIREGEKRIQEDTVIALDISDIDKPYAKKMEHLALVRDGSTGEKRSRGYWLISVLGADVEGRRSDSSFWRALFQKAEGFRSENRQILDTVDRVKGRDRNQGLGDRSRRDRSILLRGFGQGVTICSFRLVGGRDLVLRDGGNRRR